MTCTDVRSTLLRGEVPSGAAADAHLGDCAGCSALVASGGALAAALGTEPTPSADYAELYTSLKQEVADERGIRGFLRSRSTATRVVALAALIVALAVYVVVFKPRSDLADAPRGRMIAVMVSFGALAFGSIVVALRPVHAPTLPARIGRLLLVGGLAAVVGFAIAPAVGETAILDGGEHFSRMAMSCFMFGSMLALPLLALGCLLDRGGDLVGGRLLLAGGAAGLSGNLFLELHCSLQLPAHYLAGHASVVVGMLIAGLFLATIRR